MLRSLIYAFSVNRWFSWTHLTSIRIVTDLFLDWNSTMIAKFILFLFTFYTVWCSIRIGKSWSIQNNCKFTKQVVLNLIVVAINLVFQKRRIKLFCDNLKQLLLGDKNWKDSVLSINTRQSFFIYFKFYTLFQILRNKLKLENILGWVCPLDYIAVCSWLIAVHMAQKIKRILLIYWKASISLFVNNRLER